MLMASHRTCIRPGDVAELGGSTVSEGAFQSAAAADSLAGTSLDRADLSVVVLDGPARADGKTATATSLRRIRSLS